MEWRQQTSVSCADAFTEAQRWIQEVTGKLFGCSDFRAALETGVLLCDLINHLKPGIIKKVNRLSTPIAGLDNVSVFLKACGKLGLNESKLFHPGDLQDLSTRVTLRRDESSRRLKNVLITIYWLGRKAQLDSSYSGPQLNFKAFEGLLGLALSKSLDEGSSVLIKDDWHLEREEPQRVRPSYRRQNSVDDDAMDSHARQTNSEGCGSDAEAEQVFRMASFHQNKGHVPAPLLRRKQAQVENGRGCTSPIARVYENQVRPERPVQVNPGWIWSKSLSDIPMVYPVRKLPKDNGTGDVEQDANAAREWNKENTQKSNVTAKDSEAQWQDDFTKWKNRRTSFKSDLRRKSQDREHVISQMTNAAVTNFAKTDSLKRDQQSPRKNNTCPPSSLRPTSKSPSSVLRPHTRALLARSYATEAPFSPTASTVPYNSTHTQGSSLGAMPASDAIILGEDAHYSSLASGLINSAVTTPSPDYPFSSQTQVKVQGSAAPFLPTPELARPETVFSSQISTLVMTLNHKEIPLCHHPISSVICPDTVNQTAAVTPVDMSHQNPKSQEEESHKKTWEPFVGKDKGDQAAGVHKYLSRAGTWSGSASLPRGFRRSEGSSRLSSAITARPYGTKPSRVSSLPRVCTVDDNCGLLLNCDNGESLPSPTKSLLKRQSAASHLRSQYEAWIREKKDNQTKQNGKQQEEEENKVAALSSQAFNTNRDDHHSSIQTQPRPQPNSNFKSNHHYKSSALPSTKVDHSNMRVSLTLKPHSRPDFGLQTHWDSAGVRVKSVQPGSPAELCQLCVDDEIVAVDGAAVALLNYDQWKDKMTSALQSGSLTMDIRRYGNKDWSSTEGSHHAQPGHGRVTLNLTAAAPVLRGCADHHANSAASTDPAVAQALKFNGQADNVVQDTVMDGGLVDNHRKTTRSKDYSKIVMKNQERRAEFFKHEGGSESAISDLQVPSLSPASSSSLWDREEERRRQEKWQEEQERLLQEQYQRDQERLEAEWQRAQRDAGGDACRQSQNSGSVGTHLQVNTQTHKASEKKQPTPDRDEPKEDAGSKPMSDVHARGRQSDKNTEHDWAKSLSTSALAGCHKQKRGDQRKTKAAQSLSKVELERQQILEEMKKRTQLLTDNSWIRQRSGSFYKEPVGVGAPLKRYESLDFLDTLRQSPVSAATFGLPRPHSAAAGYCAPSRNASSRYSTGGISSRKHAASMDVPYHGNSVWSASDISEERKLEPRFDTRSPTVSSAVSHSSTPVSPLCDQHAVLQITE
ncbi:LIM domain only protein 7-like isoform X1 [Solea senegalensis]|uniref:LIM domain only protein 7-like isoform X1 n=1 Tax=Solea senegalensis TaxID=28829 RepID=A0AAV6Q2I5_SOLSE|nr:LIM domain only protein 7-like isoform X1 [Solea senegalensis]